MQNAQRITLPNIRYVLRVTHYVKILMQIQDSEAFDKQAFQGEKRTIQILDKNRKSASAMVAIFGFLILGLWGVQLRKSIYDPFVYKGDDKDQLAIGADSTEADPNKDTDTDGLLDGDELALYKTSPYLEDSDSDGIKDGDEVQKGSNPNCAEGKDCSGASIQIVASSTNPADDFNQQMEGLTKQAGGLSIPANQNSDAELSKLLEGQADAASLRQILINSGVDKKSLDQVSDEDLMKSYGETLNSNKK